MTSSLLLKYKGKIIFKSKNQGLRPLIECITVNKGSYSNCKLWDKVVGLAAAKLMVYSEMICLVKTPLCSTLAREFLEEHNIPIECDHFVPMILNQDKDGPCPMEQKALTMSPEEFYTFMVQLKR